MRIFGDGSLSPEVVVDFLDGVQVVIGPFLELPAGHR